MGYFCCAYSSGWLLGGVGGRAEVVRSSVQAIGGRVVGVDGSAVIFETEAMGEAGFYRGDEEERGKGNFKFEISDFK
jgi:hypothetical protein